MRLHRFLPLAALSITLPASAQILGELKGLVTDPTGAAIAGARITLTQHSTNIRIPALTTTSGTYSFTQLNSGLYDLRVEQPSFKTLLRSGITITTGQTIRLDLTLEPGTADQTVTITADAPLLQAATSDIATAIPGPTVLALPLNSRSFIQLTQLAPGVELPPGTLLPRINGGRPRTNEYLYDGISALQPEPGQVAFFPILDDIAEFSVVSNNVPAEFGRFNGGVVNVATRSGANQLHASLYEFFRNEALNARNYFTPASTRKPEYRRNLYGATLGGPLLRGKLFAFADYQGLQQRIGITRISTVPTLAERQGVFTGVAKIYNPASGNVTRTEFPHDIITTPFDPAATALLTRIPLPTSPAAANNYTRTANDDDHQNQFDLRLDGAFAQRDRGFTRYSYFSDVESPVTPFPEGSGAITGSVIGTGNVTGLTSNLGQQFVLNETHTFGPRLLNDFRIGYTRRGNSQRGTTLGNTASTALGIPGIPTNATFNNSLQLFTFTGFQQLGTSPSTSARYQTSVGQLVDTVVFPTGKHAFKFGGDLRRYELNAIAPPNPTGAFAFTTTGTDTTGATGAATGGNSFASFLLGQVDTFQIDLQTRTIRPRAYIYETFAQDDWRVTPRLILNLGARYTLHLPSTETHDQGAVFNLATQQLDYLGGSNGQAGSSRSARQLHYTNLAPRIGLAFSLDAKTVIRSGFGIAFIDQSGITTPFTTPQYPFIQNVAQRTQDGYTPAFALAAGPTVAPIARDANAGLGQSVYTVTRNAGSGYAQQWNLAIQRSITRNLSVDIAYAGSHVVHIGIPDENLNQLSAAQLATGLANPASLIAKVPNPYYNQLPTGSTLNTPTIAAAQLLKPYPRFQNVAIYRNNTGNSNYNAIEAKLEQRVTYGLSLLVAYTHSRLMDDAGSVFSSTVLSSPNSSSLVAADTFRPYLERDVSTGDMPNVTTAGIVYNLPSFGKPVGKLGRKLVGQPVGTLGAPSFRGPISKGWGALLNPAKALLSGWQANTILTLQSGMPFPITQATNSNAFAGFVLQRPNLTGSGNLAPAARTPAHFINTTAFTTAPQFTLGNASRNPARGPAYRNADLSLIKHTPIADHYDLEFRAELFNLTNTPAFAQPNGSFGSPAFGSITATTTDPRVAQFALRLSR